MTPPSCWEEMFSVDALAQPQQGGWLELLQDVTELVG
jgi:hypothetical protein